ncbi:MAG: TVP38/TMEM64 family protein [Myxococcaceae bacterium]|nr:TVP38/TMEM64 family protein [Myxococcaceae bacterium]
MMPAVTPSRSRTWLRLAALALLLAGGWWLARVTGLSSQLTTDRLRETVAAAGGWALVVFVALFAVGLLVQVPGVVFLLLARVVWGPLEAFLIGYAGAVLASAIVFAVVRGIGGAPLAEVRWPPAKAVLAGLERRPVLSVALLRTVLILTPPLNYALALSKLRHRDHLLGSALGLLVPVCAVMFLSEGALALLRSLGN